MEKKLYKCEFFSGYFTFLSSDDDKEKDAVNLAYENFKINADEITSVELADEDETGKPVNEIVKGKRIVTENPAFGDRIECESVEELEALLNEMGYMPEDGLKEGRDYSFISDDKPESLDDLLIQIKSGKLDDEDWSSFPIFGGETPASTVRVWSWDETRLLIGNCADDMRIINRE